MLNKTTLNSPYREPDEVQQNRLLELLTQSPTVPVFIGPLVFYQKDIVVVTRYENRDRLPEGFYHRYLQTAYEKGKNVYEVNLTLAMSSVFTPKPTVTSDLWEKIWDPKPNQTKVTYLFRFERYTPDGDWFKLAAMARLKASVKVSAPKLMRVGRWLIPANDPMFAAIVASEKPVDDRINRANKEANKKKEVCHD